MKLLLVLCTVLAIITPAMAADKKDRKPLKKEKEMPMNVYSIVVEGTDNADIVRTMLGYVKDAKVDSCEVKDGKIEAVVSSKARLSRSDISRVQKEHKDIKDIKITEFKVKRPDRAKKEEPKKEEPKKEEPKKEEPKKAEPAKPATPEKSK